MEENTLLNQFRDEVSKLKGKENYGMKCEAEFDVQYPTMLLPLDYLNGQRIHVEDPEHGRVFDYDSIGIVDGSINLFIGRSGCGKSTLVKQCAANIIRPFDNGVIFEDSIEGGIVARRNEILTGFDPLTLKKRLIARNSGISCESFYKRIKLIHDIKIDSLDKFRYDTGLFDSTGNRIYKLQPTIYILDSLPLLMPEKLTQEEEISGQMSTTATAKMIANIFRRIVPILKSANIILFVINHVTTQIEINPFSHSKTQNIFLKQGETCPGGVTPFYLANNVFRLDDNTKLSEDKELGIAGNFVTVTPIKSRTSRAGTSVDLVFNQDTGFDSDLSLYIMLKKNGRIKGAGAYLYIGDRDDKKFSQKNLKEKLSTDEEFGAIFINECIDVLESSMNKSFNTETSSINLNTNSISYNILNKLHQTIPELK